MRLPLCDEEHDLSDVAMLPLTCAATNMEKKNEQRRKEQNPIARCVAADNART
jgi:hypothetical protein